MSPDNTNPMQIKMLDHFIHLLFRDFRFLFLFSGGNPPVMKGTRGIWRETFLIQFLMRVLFLLNQYVAIILTRPHKVIAMEARL